MLPVRAPRRDPAPSRFRYRMTRLWLRPGLRRFVSLGLPVLFVVFLIAFLAAKFNVVGRALSAYQVVRTTVVSQPQFTISRYHLPDISDALAEQIREAAFVELPVSSLEIDAASVRKRVEALDAVERASVRVTTNGALEIRAIERVPVILWRSERGLILLDHDGVRVAEVDSRLRRPDLPLILGRGAQARVQEALALIADAQPIAARLRGLVWVGERRWDLVLDRGQTIMLPETDPVTALRRVMALHGSEELLGRDLVVVDMRNARRPMLRLSDHAMSELIRLRLIAMGEDA